MAKSKRKVSAKQRDKEAIAIAKYLKKVGALSKQTKLNSGRYISRAVLKKVDALRFVESNGYVAAKVTKSQLANAKAQGYTVVNNRVIIPPDKQWKKRLADNLTVGVIPIRGGAMEMVVSPYRDLSSLIKGLRSGELDAMKMPEEQFMFTLFGNMSYGGLRDSEHLAEYLMRYDSAIEALEGKPEDMTDYVKNLVLFRVNRTDVSRFENKGQNVGKNRTSKAGSRQYEKREERLKQMGEIANERRKKDRALKQAKYRENLDPQKAALQREKNRLRELERRNAKK